MWKQLVSHQFEKRCYDANPDVGTFLSLRCPPGQPARANPQRPGAAMLTVNRELVLLYWQIGREILLQQDAQGWGARVIDRLSQDLRQAFPGMKGFSARNLKCMRAFAEAWSDAQFVQQVVAQLSAV